MLDRSRAPAVAADRPFRFPDIRKRRLANGLSLWTVSHGRVPVVTMVLLVRAGSSADPPDSPGLASLTGDMLDEGGGGRTALEMHEALARIGAQFDTEVGPDATFLTLTTLSRFRRDGLELLGDMVARPRFDPAEFERVRQLRMNRLRQLKDVPSATADRAFTAALFGTHPYGHLAIGTMAALETMSLDQVRAFHQAAFVPGRAVLIMTGDLDHDAAERDALDVLSLWDAPAGWTPMPEPMLGAPPEPRDKVLLVDRPGAAQSELRVGHAGAPRSTRDYHALLVANLVLGGQFVSRLNMNLRERRGFTYGARSFFEFRVGAGAFQMQASVQTDATAEAIREAIGEVERLCSTAPITGAELDTARAALTLGYPRNFETADQIARSVAQLALYELPDDYFATFVPRIRDLTLEDVQDAACRHLRPDRLVSLAVGDAARVASGLEALGRGPVVRLDPP
ncbi:MAG TPA: pitrilysin family protein [Vicinamibacterales bacterium]